MPGMTFKSVTLALLGIVFMAVMSQIFGVFAPGSGAPFGEEAIPLTALISFSLLIAVGGVVYVATHYRILQPPEMLCVMYILLLAAPLLTTGFWRLMIASSASVVKAEDWEHYDSMSSKLWPHGADLLAGRLENPSAAGNTVQGNVHWEKIAVAPGNSHPMPVLENGPGNGSSSIFFQLPVMDHGAIKLPLDEPYVMILRARAENLGGQSRYYVHLFYDNDPTYAAELFSSFDPKKVTYYQPEGFNRHGLYGFILPSRIKDHITVEVGLSGPGRLDVADLNFFNVSTLQGAFTGRRLVTNEVYNQLSPAQRTSLVVMPASFFSWNGIRFLLDGYIPWVEWRGPIILWGGYVVFLLAATFALSSLLRGQWVENERFPLPLTQVPIVLAGLERQLREGASYLRNPYLWGGFAIMFFYTGCSSLRFFFPALPDLSVNIPLKSDLPDPSWGKTWETNLTFSGLAFALALFMDLNVLFSLIVGFFLFRFQFWFGEAQGLTVDDKYPYGMQQMSGAILSYGLIILFVARRFLAGTIREAWRGGKSEEVLSPRTAYLVLLAALVCIGILTHWAGLGVTGPMVLSICVLLTLLVAMRMRAEMGYTNAAVLGVFDGSQTMLFAFTALGSLSFFNAQTAIFWGFFTSIFFTSCFFILPGLQFELVALGHRLKVRRGDIISAGAVGILGGLVIGGWVYLSGAYAVGADNFPIIGQYEPLSGLTFLADTTSKDVSSGNASYAGSWLDSPHLAFLFGAIVTTVLGFLRQLYAGFWFHPFGFILGASGMMQNQWGSILAAWAVRLGVLRLGGAISVRERLFPFAVGCVLAIVAVSFLVSILHGYNYFFNPGAPKPMDLY
jgi:hypothetical protein